MRDKEFLRAKPRVIRPKEPEPPRHSWIVVFVLLTLLTILQAALLYRAVFP